MSSLNKIVFSIWEKIRPEISDDDAISKRQIKDVVNIHRAMLLRRELNKNRTIHPSVVQDLGCVPMEEVDSAECCEINSDCTIVRTKQRIPNPIELYNKEGFTRVGPVDKKGKPFSLVPYNRAIFATYSRFTGHNKIFAYYLNDRIYLVSNNPYVNAITHINIRGVFEDPEEASNFITCDNVPCWTDDSEYPMMDWMRPMLEEMAIKSLLPVAIQIPTDGTNDGASKVEQQ
jgi:aspartate carbamoyltransferase regulatory subunit